MSQKIYPRSKDKETVYLKNVITNPDIIAGDYTIYNDFVKEPKDFEKNNVLYQYPINQDKLIIGKFCSIACGAKFIFNSANHTLSSLSTYPFPIFFEEWALDAKDIPPYTIAGGVPAKPIRKRFTQETIDSLLKMKWWNWSEESIRQHITEIQSGNIKYLYGRL